MFDGGFGENRWVLGGVLGGVLGEALPAFWPRLGLRFGGWKSRDWVRPWVRARRLVLPMKIR